MIYKNFPKFKEIMPIRSLIHREQQVYQKDAFIPMKI